MVMNHLFLSFSVCLLGVLTLVISWASLGLEFTVAVVSILAETPLMLLDFMQIYFCFVLWLSKKCRDK